jgi:uncharacterized cysteine cluster protein YcgN (CxxCxxCC family)
MNAYWKNKDLADLSPDEWEALCDGCGRCCLYKLEDDEGFIYYTRVACRFLDLHECRCTSYENRAEVMPTCIVLDVEKAHELGWLPDTCAYRLLALGKDLPKWHPLVSGNKNTILRAGISIRRLAISETEADLDSLENYIIEL